MHPCDKPFSKRTAHRWIRRLVAAAGLVAGVSGVIDVRASQTTFTFPMPNPGWVIARTGGLPVGDIEGDASTARDIVGDAAHPALYIASDATHLYFRLRLDIDPRQAATNIGPFGWGCLINTDGDPTTYEYATIVDGVNNPDAIYFYKNTMTTVPNSPADAPDIPAITTVTDPLTAAVAHAQVVPITPGSFGDNANVDDDFFMDWAIELGPALAAGFNPANPANYYCGSANNGTNIGTDCLGTLPGNTGCGPLDSIFTDSIACGPLGCAICGDGQKGAVEGCDDGNRTSGDGCNSVCLLELGEACTASSACASGACDAVDAICVCDENADCSGVQVCNTIAAPNICVNPGCGNGVVEPGEGCDDNNMTNGDGCTSGCLIELGRSCPGGSATCASGFCDSTDTRCACDENADCPGVEVCNVNAMPNACVNPGCGNHVIEPGEGCDDGNKVVGDGCTPACLLELGQTCSGASSDCVSGFCDSAGNVCACNEDSDCSGGKLCNTTASPNQCVPLGCGNGVLEAGEACDDGNTTAGDGCNLSCLLELGQTCAMNTSCASGLCDMNVCACDQDSDCVMGEVCRTSSAPNACVPPSCGNGVIEANESCDDGNTSAGDGCDSSCAKELGQSCMNSTECGSGNCDGTVNQCVCDEDIDCQMGQSCNLGANPHACVPFGCGNAVIETGEGCDDGNTSPGDGCDSSCRKELGGMCMDGMECGSGNCDGTVNQCVCDKDTDCLSDEVCDTMAKPHACVIPPKGGCQADTDCMGGLFCDEPSGTCVACTRDNECAEGVCDEMSFTCVGCVQDSDCNGGICAADSRTCKPNAVVVEGTGVLCTLTSTSTHHDHLPYGLLGLLGLGALRRRRR